MPLVGITARVLVKRPSSMLSVIISQLVLIESMLFVIFGSLAEYSVTVTIFLSKPIKLPNSVFLRSN